MKKDDNKPKPKAAIEVKGVSKHFKLPHERKNSLKQHFVGLFSKKLGYEKFEALKDISFTVNEGDFFGIVGRNGSGKSTLLKIISGIYQPSSGSVKINGTLTPFIELGIGFNPELTGRENVYLNGSILGLSKKQIDALYNQIVEFAELEKFMDQKLKNYSSGMQVRLAFSIAIRAQNDILLLDEVLAVGDINFQKKCFNYFQELKRQKKTVIFVTHDMNSVKEYCNRAVLINDSKVVPTKDIDDVLEKYVAIMNPDRLKADSTAIVSVKSDKGDTPESSQPEDLNGHFAVKNSNITTDDNYIKISFSLITLSDQDDSNKFISLALKDNINNIVWSYNAARSNHIDGKLGNNKSEYNLNIKLLNILNKGNYSINLGIVNEEGHPISRFEDILEFSISSNLTSTSAVDLMEALELS